MAGPGWLWGLAPLALLWATGNLLLDDPIRQDLAGRAAASVQAAAGETATRRLTVETEGRDVVVAGDAVTADGAARGMEALRATFGVRRALGGLSQLVARKPYDWMAARGDGVVTLSGAVPDEAAARAFVSLVREALPGVRVEDRQELAFGAPEGFDAVARILIARLPRLAEGRVALDDRRACIEGTARDVEAYRVLRDGSALEQHGFSVLECPVQPPAAKPYRWRAERMPDGAVRVTGHYPEETARRDLGRRRREAFPDPVGLDDTTQPASGAPAGFAARAVRAVADLARLRSGVVEIQDGSYLISGNGPDDPAACAAIRRTIVAEQGGEAGARVEITCPPAPLEPAPPPTSAPRPADVTARPAPPSSLSLSLDGRALTLAGAAPDAAILDGIEVLAREMRPDLRVERELASGDGRALSAERIRAAALDLLRLDIGSAEVTAERASLRGITCRPLIRDEVRNGALVRSGSADVAISLRQTGCMLGPAAICQNRLDELSRRHPVLFVQGAAASTLDAVTERFVAEAVDILDGCPASRVVIEGHANSDGAERGFDNRELSERRARRLLDELTGRGVAAERLEIRAFGADRPLAQADTAEAKALNRRLQFTVMR